MQWEDRGIVLGARGHGESAVILEAMTEAHGRHHGLVHGGRSRRLRPVLQPGNTVSLVWRARLDEQLGTYTVEAETIRAERLMASGLALGGIGLLAAHLRLLPERDPHPDLFGAAHLVAEHLHDQVEAPALMALFELRLLAELGFGLDLDTCAATGRRDNLGFVSPRTGRAVETEAAEPYRDRLLALPRFLTVSDGDQPPAQDIEAAFRLTGHFLDTRIYEPRGLVAPDERGRFVTLATRRAPGASAAPEPA